MANCTRKTIRFRTKRGKTISFTGRTGAGCGPRRKPSTGHLRLYKGIFKDASKSCQRRYKPFTKSFGRCMKDAFRAA